MLDFTAIDFETANSKRASVCAVGATRVRDGRIVERFDQLVHPPLGYDEFNEWNIRVHHIHPEDVAQSPSWPEVVPRLSAFIGNDTLVAHNANFDSSVMVAACEATNLRWQVPQIVCTLQLARTHLELPSYKLLEYRKNSDSQSSRITRREPTRTLQHTCLSHSQRGSEQPPSQKYKPPSQLANPPQHEHCQTTSFPRPVRLWPSADSSRTFQS